MDKALRSRLTRQTGEPRRRGMVQPVEALRAALAQDPDAIDDRVVAGEEGGQQSLVFDRDIEQPDLPDIALQLEELGRGGVAAADRQHVAALGQPLDDIAPDKPRPAEDRHPVIHARSLKARRALAKPPRPGNPGVGCSLRTNDQRVF